MCKLSLTAGGRTSSLSVNSCSRVQDHICKLKREETNICPGLILLSELRQRVLFLFAGATSLLSLCFISCVGQPKHFEDRGNLATYPFALRWFGTIQSCVEGIAKIHPRSSYEFAVSPWVCSSTRNQKYSASLKWLIPYLFFCKKSRPQEKIHVQPLKPGNCTAELGLCFLKTYLPPLSKDSCALGNWMGCRVRWEL